MKPLTSGDIEFNLNGQTILSVGSTMLLNMRSRQLGLRPVDVGGEGDFFSKQFLISYSVYGDPNRHLLIRQVGFQYVSNNPECFTESNTENSWNVYINNVIARYMVRCTVCTSSCRLSKCSSSSGVSLSFCAGGQWGFSVGDFEVFLMKEKTKTAGKIDG